MKKISLFLILVLIFTTLIFIGCENTSDVVNDAKLEDEQQNVNELKEEGEENLPDNIIKYTHVDGRGVEEEMNAYILYEYELMDIVKYQVAYLACTCRGPVVNYSSIAYIELNKSDGSVKTVSYGKDGENGHYTAGMFGDSLVTEEGVPNWENFQKFLAEEIIGSTQEKIQSMEAMHGEVDTYTGATVTPNNLVRVLQSLFEYHNEKYNN